MLKKALWYIFNFLLGAIFDVALRISVEWWAFIPLFVWVAIITSRPARKLEVGDYISGPYLFIAGILVVLATKGFWYNPLLDLIGG